MRVLVACEFSATVRDAFTALGHDAWSWDLLPSERNGKHLLGPIEFPLEPVWDLMIAHPPCTYLCNSGVRWLYGGKGTTRDGQRWGEMEKAAEFFRTLLRSDIPRIAIENPIPHSYAIERIGENYSQTIQPWQFGHGETKRTCLWLKNLPPLKPTNIVEGRTPKVHFASPGPNRWRERSRTYAGVGAAMAAQWGCL
jgi:hypothetical protein